MTYPNVPYSTLHIRILSHGPSWAKTRSCLPLMGILAEYDDKNGSRRKASNFRYRVTLALLSKKPIDLLNCKRLSAGWHVDNKSDVLLTVLRSSGPGHSSRG